MSVRKQLRRNVVHRIVSQFMHPRGLPGRLVGWEMALRPSNRKRNAWAVSLLDVQPTDRVLEIGFGPGIAVREVARRATRGQVVGIDHSEVMRAQAARRGCGQSRSSAWKELARLLRGSGEIAVVSQPRCPGATAETTKAAAREIVEQLDAAGFVATRVETLDLEPPVACVIGTAPSAAERSSTPDNHTGGA